MELRNPYPLRRQKAFLVPGVVPEKYLEKLKDIPTWDEWDPDHDRFQILEKQNELARDPHVNEGRM